MSVVIGGEKAWRKRQLGDLGIAYHWINDEPAMCLFPIRKRIADAGAYIICLSAAHQYVHSDGHPDLDYMIPAAVDAAVTMGFDRNDQFIVRRIIDAICDGMPDLVDMPPQPEDLVEKAVKETVGELSIQLDGKQIVEQEVSALDAAEMTGAAN